MTATAAPTYGWVPVTDLVEGGYYRFVALVPPSWTSNQTQAYLDTSLGGALGWDVRSIGAPPADVTAAVAAAKVVFPNGVIPQAFYVLGGWGGSAGTIPTDPQGQLVYEQMMGYAQVPAGTPGDSTDPLPVTAAPPTPAAKSILPTLLYVGGALALAFTLFADFENVASRVKARRQAQPNPIPVPQKLDLHVDGRKVVFHVEAEPGNRWLAKTAVTGARGVKSMIAGSGSSRAQAIQQAVHKVRKVFDTMDVKG